MLRKAIVRTAMNMSVKPVHLKKEKQNVEDTVAIFVPAVRTNNPEILQNIPRRLAGVFL